MNAREPLQIQAFDDFSTRRRLKTRNGFSKKCFTRLENVESGSFLQSLMQATPVTNEHNMKRR